MVETQRLSFSFDAKNRSGIASVGLSRNHWERVEKEIVNIGEPHKSCFRELIKPPRQYNLMGHGYATDLEFTVVISRIYRHSMTILTHQREGLHLCPEMLS